MMEGWLTKRRDHMNLIWMERYFILDGNQLRYYKKRGDPTPRGTYVLTRGCVIGYVFNSEEKHKHHGAVWMFRITFAVEEGEKSYKKDRFIDLGAKSENEAHAWKKALENALTSVREIAETQRISRPADIGAPPASVQKLLNQFEDTLFNLGDDDDKSDQGWGIVRIEGGLRVMKEFVNSGTAAELIEGGNTYFYGVALSGVLLSLGFVFVAKWRMLLLLGTGIPLILFMLVKSKKNVEIPSYRVSQIVRGTPKEIFQLIRDVHRVNRWDCVTATKRVIQAMDDHADILYIKQKPCFIWPIWLKPRDMVLVRYWRREEDGSYFVMYQSTTHPECRPRPDYVRANLLGGGFIIAPQKISRGDTASLVTYVLRYDPGTIGYWFPRCSVGLDLLMPMLRNVIGIRDEMASTGFIKPMVTMDGIGETSSPIAPSIDSSGILLGVKKIPCNLPEQMWGEPDASKFEIRGPTYLINRKKIPGGPVGFHLVGVDLFSFDEPSARYGMGGKYNKHIELSKEFTFIINMVVPGPENMSLVFYYQPARPNIFTDGSAFSELLNDFVDGDDAFRNSRFKLIPTVVQGSYIVKQSVGSKPALIGNKLNCPYKRGDNFFEVDIDISSNTVANTVVGMVKGLTKSLVVDIAFLFESQSEEELPETILGTIRLLQISLDNPTKVVTKP